MRTHAPLLLVCLLFAPAAWAGPFGGGADLQAQQARQQRDLQSRNATWRQRLAERIRQQWAKPAGEAFARPYQRPASQLGRTGSPGSLPRSHAPNPIERRVQALGGERRSPWSITGGFGQLIRRAVVQVRLGWQARFGRPGTLIARVPRAMGRGLAKMRAGARGLTSAVPVHDPGISKPVRVSAPRFRPAAKGTIKAPRFRAASRRFQAAPPRFRAAAPRFRVVGQN